MEDNSKHILIEKKECTKCNILKNICEFRVRKDRKCGYRSSCKECEKVSSKKWIEKNIDYYKKRTKVYNKKHYVLCECGNPSFKEVMYIRKESRLMSGLPEDRIVPIQLI